MQRDYLYLLIIYTWNIQIYIRNVIESSFHMIGCHMIKVSMHARFDHTRWLACQGWGMVHMEVVPKRWSHSHIPPHKDKIHLING